MLRRGASVPRRSATEWGIRGGLAVIAALLGYCSVTYSLGYALKERPKQAHTLAPDDGRLTARLSQTFLTAKATAADRAEADKLARLALEQDPTAVRAVETLGLNAQIRGDTIGARRLFAYAGKLSRRELQTQLWAIEDAVSRDDVAGALRQYDIALRTSRNAPDLLFPVLASAATDPAIRSALIKTLSGQPNWSEEFVDFVARSGPDPRATASLFHGLQQSGVSVSEGASTIAINALVSSGFLEDAWAYYASVRPGADRRASRDSRFTADMVMPSLFDWRPINEAGVTTSIQSGERGGIFDFAAPASIGGPLLQQMQMLPPGNYRLEGHSVDVDQPESSRPYWVLRCQDGRELGRLPLPNSARANGAFAGQFNVPAGCPAQVLALIARPSDSVSGVAGQIDQVRLYPVP